MNPLNHFLPATFLMPENPSMPCSWAYSKPSPCILKVVKGNPDCENLLICSASSSSSLGGKNMWVALTSREMPKQASQGASDSLTEGLSGDAVCIGNLLIAELLPCVPQGSLGKILDQCIPHVHDVP